MSISRQADARYHSPRVRPKSVRSVGGHSDPTTPPPGAMPECHRPASAGNGPTWFPGREHLQRRLPAKLHDNGQAAARSEEHTSELQSLMRISYAVFCLKKKNNKKKHCK